MRLVPANRLIFWSLAVFVPAVAVLLTVPAGGVFVLPLLLAGFGLAGWDAVRSRGILAGASVRSDPVVRLYRGRSGVIPLVVDAPALANRVVRVGLALPEAVRADGESLELELPPQGGPGRIEWACEARERGRFPLDACNLEASSRLGCWMVRRVVPLAMELRVYPDLLSERRNVSALFLNRGGPGIHPRRHVGKGREFDKLRDYVSGDSMDDVHWKASAKRGHLVTKLFQIERMQEVYIVVDSSRLSSRPVGHEAGTSVLERQLVAAMILGLAAERQGDQYGFVGFSDRVTSFLRAKRGTLHYGAFRDTLFTLEGSGASPDFDEMATFLRVRLRKRALLVFLTALDDPVLSEAFIRATGLLARRHLVLVNMLKPPGADPLFAQREPAGEDALYDALAGHLRWQRLGEMGKLLHRQGVEFHLLENERMAADLVRQYLAIKARQVL